MSFTEEFDKRLRRVCGVTDDTRPVSYELDFDKAMFSGCDTCGYGGDDDRTYVTVRVTGTKEHDWRDYVHREFEDMGELMRALDAVKL